jgi:hypothetical protein
MDKSYNGWTNWETWNFGLWLDNDEPTYHEINQLIKGSKDVYDLSKKLEEWAYGSLDDEYMDSSFIMDFVNGAIREVNFFEIAEHRIEEKDYLD